MKNALTMSFLYSISNSRFQHMPHAGNNQPATFCSVCHSCSSVPPQGTIRAKQVGVSEQLLQLGRKLEMGKSRTGSSWFRLSGALFLIATPFVFLGTQPMPLVAPTKVEAVAVSEPTAEVKSAGQCGSKDWPSPNNCNSNAAPVRIITPTTTGVPAEAFRAAEAQVAVQVEELMKHARAKANPEKPLPTILPHASSRPQHTSQKYARRAPPEYGRPERRCWDLVTKTTNNHRVKARLR